MGYGIISIEGTKMKLISTGVIELKKYPDHYVRLQRIFERVTALIDSYHPDELAIEAPFFGKNVQSMLKLGRAQGVAIAASLNRSIPVFEYAPKKIKQSITGKGTASKEQVSAMVMRLLNLKTQPKYLDATDGLAAAVCHYFQRNTLSKEKKYSSWEAFVKDRKK